MKKFLGIEIGGTKLQIVSGDANGRIDHRFLYTVNREEGAQGICHHIAEALQYWKDDQIDGIGVGFGGPVDRSAGSVWTSYHINGWSGFNFSDWLWQLAGAPVVLENDANVAALGEARYGAGKDDSIVFYVTLGSGVGGGLVIDQKIYHGVVPGEAEFGHVRLDKTGRTVQSSCSGWSVNNKIREVAAAYPESVIAQLTSGITGDEAKILLQAIEKHDPHAMHIINETADDLAYGLSHVVHLFHPSVIILGGGLSLVGEPLRVAVAQRMSNYIMDAFQPAPAVRLSALKTDAVPIGALVLASQQTTL